MGRAPLMLMRRIQAIVPTLSVLLLGFVAFQMHLVRLEIALEDSDPPRIASLDWDDLAAPRATMNLTGYRFG